MPGKSRKAAAATIQRDVMIISVSFAGGSLRSCLERKCAEESREIVRLFERPQGRKNGGRLFFRPAPADVAAEFPFQFGFGHRPLGETGRMIHLAGDAPASLATSIAATIAVWV